MSPGKTEKLPFTPAELAFFNSFLEISVLASTNIALNVPLERRLKDRLSKVRKTGDLVADVESDQLVRYFVEERNSFSSNGGQRALQIENLVALLTPDDSALFFRKVTLLSITREDLRHLESILELNSLTETDQVELRNHVANLPDEERSRIFDYLERAGEERGIELVSFLKAEQSGKVRMQVAEISDTDCIGNALLTTRETIEDCLKRIMIRVDGLRKIGPIEEGNGTHVATLTENTIIVGLKCAGSEEITFYFDEACLKLRCATLSEDQEIDGIMFPAGTKITSYKRKPYISVWDQGNFEFTATLSASCNIHGTVFPAGTCIHRHPFFNNDGGYSITIPQKMSFHGIDFLEETTIHYNLDPRVFSVKLSKRMTFSGIDFPEQTLIIFTGNGRIFSLYLNSDISIGKTELRGKTEVTFFENGKLCKVVLNQTNHPNHGEGLDTRTSMLFYESGKPYSVSTFHENISEGPKATAKMVMTFNEDGTICSFDRFRESGFFKRQF